MSDDSISIAGTAASAQPQLRSPNGAPSAVVLPQTVTAQPHGRVASPKRTATGISQGAHPASPARKSQQSVQILTPVPQVVQQPADELMSSLAQDSSSEYNSVIDDSNASFHSSPAASASSARGSLRMVKTTSKLPAEQAKMDSESELGVSALDSSSDDDASTFSGCALPPPQLALWVHAARHLCCAWCDSLQVRCLRRRLWCDSAARNQSGSTPGSHFPATAPETWDWPPAGVGFTQVASLLLNVMRPQP